MNSSFFSKIRRKLSFPVTVGNPTELTAVDPQGDGIPYGGRLDEVQDGRIVLDPGRFPPTEVNAAHLDSRAWNKSSKHNQAITGKQAICHTHPGSCEAYPANYPEALSAGGGLCRNVLRSSWEFRINSSQMEYIPMENIKMESVALNARTRMHRIFRECFTAIGIAFTAICLLVVELCRMLAYTVLRPLLTLVRFVAHLLLNLLFDLLYICTLQCRRVCMPLVDLFAMCSHEVIIPSIRQCRPIRCIHKMPHPEQCQSGV
ncbi:unnamed protein product [Dicrocoelium dendriticum]|nr:unnamed protein product [Dicrocoelium dendriticum]